MIEILTENLGAGELKTFMYQGEYVEVLDAAYPFDVFMMDRAGGQISVMRNAEASFFSRPGRFEVIQIQSAKAQTVRLFVGSGDAGTRRAAGVVQVVDGGKARTLANAALSCWGTAPASAGNFSYAQLWNPAGSGKNLIVEQLAIASTVATGFVHCARNAAAAFFTAQAARSKLMNAAPGTLTESRQEAVAAQLGGIFALSNGAINTQIMYRPTAPIVVPPGQGYCVQAQTVNADVSVSWEWHEQSLLTLTQ